MVVSSRKALRREARREKNERKAENYMKLKKESKLRAKARYMAAHDSKKLSQGLVTKTMHSLPVAASKRAEPSKANSRQHYANSMLPSDLEMEDPLLAFADKALEKGILGSNGEFDEDRMNNIFNASDSELLSESHESEQDMGHAVGITTQSKEEVQSFLPNSASQGIRHSDASKLQRLVQGHLNRLALGNFESIALSMAGDAEVHGRIQFMETFAASLCGFLATDVSLLDSYLLNYAALTAALVYCVGTDLVGYVLEQLVGELDQRRRDLREVQVADLKGPSHLKAFMNIITILSFLYDLQTISKAAILEVIGECIERIEYEYEVEGLVRLIRLCGAQLRQEDPISLRKAIGLIQEKSQCHHVSSQSSRFRFMLDVVQDLKNNKQKLVAIQRGDMEVVKKLLRSLQQARGLKKIDPLNVSLNDIREAKSKGRWWKIGAAWKGRERAEVAPPVLEGNEDTRLLTIAKEQRMNTDVRRAIFGALMTSEDCHDAFRRLLALRLSSRQERELVHVILHCLCKEKVYNPYYVLVAGKFIENRHNFEISFKYALWDRLTLLQKDELGERDITHLATFYGTLIARTLLPLSSLCKVSFASPSASIAVFLSLLLGFLFEQAKADIDITTIFEKLNQSSHRKGEDTTDQVEEFGDSSEEHTDEKVLNVRRLELANFRIGLKLFLRQQFDAITKLASNPCVLPRMENAWRVLNQ